MIYATGRTATLTGSCQLTGNFILSFSSPKKPTDLDGPDDPLPAAPSAAATLGAGFAACNGSLRSGTRNLVGGGGFEYGVYINVGTPVGNSEELFVSFGTGQRPPPNSGLVNTYTFNVDYTFTASLACEECIEITGAGSMSTIDSPFGSGRRLFLRHTPGGSISASLGPASAGGTVPLNATTSEVQPVLSGNAACTVADTGAGSWSVTPLSPNNEVWFVPSLPTAVSCSAQYYGQGSISTPLSITLSSQQNSDSNNYSGQVRASGDFEAWQPKQFVVSGVARAMEQPYPDGLKGECFRFVGDTETDAEFDIAGGAFSTSATQNRGQINVGVRFPPSATIVGNASAASGINQWLPISCRIKPGSLTAAGDDPRATRLLMKGRTFAGLSIAKANVTVDAGTSLSPTGAWAGNWEAVGSGAAPSIAGGGVSFLGSVRRAFTHDVSFTGSRHLRLTMKANAPNAPFTLAIGGKSWQVKAGADTGAFSVVDIDLAAENSETATTSAHDTKWPLQRNDDLSGDDLPLSEGAYFGVQRVSSLTLSGAAGTSFIVSKIELVTKGAITADWVPAFYRGQVIYKGGFPTGIDESWPTQQYPNRSFGTGGEGLSEYYARRGPLVNADGVQMEQEDSTYQIDTPPNEGDSHLSAGEVSIERLAQNINRVNANGTALNPGYVAEALKAPSGCSPASPALPSYLDCWLSSDRPASYLWGTGAMVTGAGNWTFGFNQPLSASAQEGFDSFDCYPGCDDFFGFGGSGKAARTVYLCAGAILRGSLHGLTLTTSKQPANEKTVELRQGTPAPGLVVSSGTGEANGYYKASSGPFAKTALAALAKSGSLSAGFTAYGRKRQRVVFVLAGLAKWISADIGPTGRHVRAFGGDGLMAGASNVFAANVGSDGEIGPGARPCVRYDANGELALLFEQEGSIALLRSDSQGRTWLAPMTVSNSGFFPALAIGATGLLYCFWRTDSGGIAGKILDAQAKVVFPATGTISVVGSGVAEDAIAASCDPLTRRVFVHYRNDAGAIVIVISSDNGRSYS